MEVIMNDPNALKALQDLAKGKIKSALTDVSNKDFNFDTSKRLVTDFFTRRQEQMFYGQDMKTYKTMVPGADSALVKIKRGKMVMISNGEEVSDLKDYIDKGGSYSHLQEMGYKWNNTKKKWDQNANWGKNNSTAKY